MFCNQCPPLECPSRGRIYMAGVLIVFLGVFKPCAASVDVKMGRGPCLRYPARDKKRAMLIVPVLVWICGVSYVMYFACAAGFFSSVMV